MPKKETMCKRKILFLCGAKDFQDVLKCMYMERSPKHDLLWCKYADKAYNAKWGSGKHSIVICTHKNARRTK